MNKNSICFEHIYDIQFCYKVKDIKKYLHWLLDNYHKLNEYKDKRTYLKKIQNFYQDYMRGLIMSKIDNKKFYTVYDYKESAQTLVIQQFGNIKKLNDIDRVINDILELINDMQEKHDTQRVLKKDIDKVFKIIENKYPKFIKFLKQKNIEILLFNNTDKHSNSIAFPSKNLSSFKICCFYMRNNEEYKNGLLNPIYVFIHEIGHILCWLSINGEEKIPNSFLKHMNFGINNPKDEDLLEVFADSFAMALMFNSKLSKYNPFTEFSEDLFNTLEDYFKELTSNLI